MRELVLVGLGGFLGSISRYYFGGIVLHLSGTSRFPTSTLVVNILGCFLIGLLATIAERWHWFSMDHRLLIFTGVLGGFTTFSAFGYETFYLIRTSELSLALVNISAQLIFGLGAVWVGAYLARLG